MAFPFAETIAAQPGRQTEFLRSPADMCIYGGAAGGGKTAGLILEPLRHVGRIANFTAVFFRRTMPQITNPGALWDESLNFYPRLGGTPHLRMREWRWPRGGKIKFSHLQFETTGYDWQGAQITLICFDELTHFSAHQFFYMVSDGVMFPGSPLHIYDPTPCVMRQIDFARAAFAAGVPVWGSCCGLQLAVVALGGSVQRNPRGRELPIARAITVTEAGRAHPLLASRPAVFDALCSHLDEIETLPPNSQVLAANEVSAVQAIAAQTPGRGSFHGTQYHPEHTLAVSAALIEIRAAELVEEGFGIEPSEIVAIAADYRALHAEPTRRDLLWRYGIASEIMDPVRRTTEIGNWLLTVVERRGFVA